MSNAVIETRLAIISSPTLSDAVPRRFKDKNRKDAYAEIRLTPETEATLRETLVNVGVGPIKNSKSSL
jgi:hypothetical protein